MSATSNGLKLLHDRLLSEMPDGSEHDVESCPICAMEATDNHDTPGGSMPETFTQDDIDAAVAAATTSLQQRLGELEAQVQETEVGRAVSEAVAAKETQISDLQSRLDAAEAARTAAENKLTETEQYWTDAIAAHEQAAAFAARRDQRVAKAREAGVFNEDYITANADRFAAMSDEDFDAAVSEWTLIAAKYQRDGVQAKGAGTATPGTTALVASAATASPTSGLGLLSELRVNRVDPRALGGN